jgi:hypothetical protein
MILIMEQFKPCTAKRKPESAEKEISHHKPNEKDVENWETQEETVEGGNAQCNKYYK